MLYDPKWTKPLTKEQQNMLDAAKLIEDYGHIKNDMGSVTRGFCISGALREAAKLSSDNFKESFELWSQSQRAVATFDQPSSDPFVRMGKVRELIEWNNAIGRTKEEVIAKLREVAHAV